MNVEIGRTALVVEGWSSAHHHNKKKKKKEIGTEAAQFPEKEYTNKIFRAVPANILYVGEIFGVANRM